MSSLYTTCGPLDPTYGNNSFGIEGTRLYMEILV